MYPFLSKFTFKKLNNKIFQVKKNKSLPKAKPKQNSDMDFLPIKLFLTVIDYVSKKLPKTWDR